MGNNKEFNNYSEFMVGDKVVRLFIPSRRKDKVPLAPDLIQDQITMVQQVFQDLFGGTTPKAPPRLGTWRHDDGSVTREEIHIIESMTNQEKIIDASIRSRVFKLAADVCHKMDQDCVFVAWDNEGWLVDDERPMRDAKVVRFTKLPQQAQDKMIQFSWMGINHINQVLQILSLDAWVTPMTESVIAGCRIIAVHPEDAYCRRIILEVSPKQKWSKKDLQEGDILLSPADHGIAIRLYHNKMLHGPKTLHFSQTGAGKITRSLLQMLLAEQLDTMALVLDQKDIRRGFFQEYKELLNELQELIKADHSVPGHEFNEAQLLMGRLMFLHFIEQSGWLCGNQNYMIDTFRQKKGNYYQEELLPLLFEKLNNGKREIGLLDVPFLNGGLFQPRKNEIKIQLPDAIFERVLSLFQRYDFTLQTNPGVDEAFAVDPSMFGKVLESLADSDTRKKEGIHYTPSPIAHALAFEPIVARLATLTGIAEDRLRKFANGNDGSLSTAEALIVKNALPKLRIVDPAVGSGALLLACLEVIMTLAEMCGQRRGEILEKGKAAWGELCRRIVCECLFGVDISPDAVEIARLRLWLAVAVGDIEPSPLPDLEFNVRCADSLYVHKELKKRLEGQLYLDLGGEFTLWSKYFHLIESYQTSAVTDPTKQHELLKQIEACQKELLENFHLRVFSAKKTKRQSKSLAEEALVEIPFDWRLQYGQVFNKNKGFDIVIANPPYVRVQSLQKAKYQDRWDVLESGSADLYYAFIQLALDLAAPDGEISFIMPNFSRTDSGQSLRKKLSDESTIRRWVDFDDTQVFSTATNYVALLFASKTKRLSDVFPCSCVRDMSWKEQSTTDWIYQKGNTSENLVEVAYGENPWLTIPSNEARAVASMREKSRPLGELANIATGIQTSADELYLFEEWDSLEQDSVRVYSRGNEKWYKIEKAMLRVCIKGARSKSKEGKNIFLLWPYNKNGVLLPADTIAKLYPLAWKYITSIEKKLRNREKGKFDNEKWYQFGRNQNIENGSKAKIIVPAIIKGPTAIKDSLGSLTHTASGEGGGGAWAIMPKDNQISLDTLERFFLSDEAWVYFKALGFPKQGGWRGIDASVLSPMPVPHAYITNL